MDRDFRVGNWVVRPERLCIHLPGKTVHITPKSMAVLECLARAGDKVVSRNDLLDTVWPGAAVTDDVLTQCIVELRKAFDDSVQDPKYIETIPKKGFRLVAEVAEVEEKPARLRLTWRAAIGIAVVLIISVAGLWYFGQESQLPPVDAKTVAVLPFADLSPDGDQEFFVDDLTEELIIRLTRLEKLQVTGRASSFYFKDRDEDIQSIGKQLGVAYVLDGSVRRAGDELKVAVRLTDVTSGFHVWSDTYERQVEDLLEVQEQIAEAVAAALSVGLGVGELAAMEGGTKSVAAYEAYLAGNAARFGPKADMMTAISHYERATELDPDYALAWAQLADACHFAAENWGEEEPYRLAERRDRAIERALSLAPESPQVVARSAQLRIFEGQYRVARLLLDDLNRRYEGRDIPTSLVYLDLSLKMGRLGDAYRAIGNIVRRDPLNPLLPTYLSQLYLLWERPDDALAEVERAIQSGNQDLGLNSMAITMALATGRRDEIEEWLERYIELLPEVWLDPYIFEHAVLERLDDRDAMLEYLGGLHSRSSRPGIEYRIVHWAAYLGDDEMALGSLQRSPEPWTFWNPLLKRVRKTDEFKQILIDAGIVDYWREFGWGSFCSPTEGDGFECH